MITLNAGSLNRTGSILLLSGSLYACVISNLDNNFDPARGGVILATELAGSGSGSAPLGEPALSETVTYNTAGSYTYTVPTDARKVELLVIGGGGGGGDTDANGTGTAEGYLGYSGESGQAGGTTTVTIQGAATILTATGGQGGSYSWCDGGAGVPCDMGAGHPAGQGLGMLNHGPGAGGAGGTPGGIAGQTGTSYSTSQIPQGGAHSGYTAGKGGNGCQGGNGNIGDPGFWPPSWYPGGAGGSGGMATTERTDLAGKALDLTIGAGGVRGATTSRPIACVIAFSPSTASSSGEPGLIEIKIYK